eukprot:scaffold196102_cov17-Tisochrysis_lutea.AAC.1
MQQLDTSRSLWNSSQTTGADTQALKPAICSGLCSTQHQPEELCKGKGSCEALASFKQAASVGGILVQVEGISDMSTDRVPGKPKTWIASPFVPQERSKKVPKRHLATGHGLVLMAWCNCLVAGGGIHPPQYSGAPSNKVLTHVKPPRLLCSFMLILPNTLFYLLAPLAVLKRLLSTHKQGQ